MVSNMAQQQTPEGYKKTEVGVIPDDWKVETIAELTSDVGDGIHSTPVYSCSGAYYFVNGNNIVNGSIRVAEDTKRVDEKEFKKHQKNLSLRTIFLSINGTIGNLAFYNNELLVLGKSAAYMNVKKQHSLEYIYYSLQTKSTNDFFSDGLTGSTIKNLGLGVIRATPIPMPVDPEEQTAIANALSDVDDLITSLEKLIAKKRAVNTAVMQQLLTGNMRLPGFEEDWKTVSIKRDASLNARIGWQALTTAEYLDQGDFYLVTGTDFKGGRVHWSTCHFVDEWRYNQDKNIQLKNGDVLLTKDGTIGKVGYVDRLGSPATLNSGVFVIRPIQNSFNPMYLFYMLSSRIFDDFLNKITAGSTITHLYQKDFVTFEFEAPNTEEQSHIAAILSSMDNELQKLEQRLNKTQQIKQGMMQELLTGRTRLV